jgi:hypothetical protein
MVGHMPKYDPLHQQLLADLARPIALTLPTMDLLVGGLPPSARTHRAWWSNEADGTHIQARAWMNAGRRVTAVDFNAGLVAFSAAV